MQLPIATERTMITTVSPADLAAYEALITIPEVADGAGFNLLSNQAMLSEVAKGQLKHPGTFGVRMDGRLIGSILLFDKVSRSGLPDSKNLEVSYFLHPDFWRKGIMTEALTQLMIALQADGKIRSISAEAFVDNVGSIALLERVGFSRVAKMVDPIVGKPKLIYHLSFD